MNSSEIKYTETHEWAKVEGEIVTVGLTDFAVQQLSDLVYIDLPKIGQKVKQGEPFGEVESVKAVADLIAPVSGEICAINETISTNLELVTKDPFGAGWLVKIKMSNPAELEKLLSQQDYDKLCQTQ